MRSSVFVCARAIAAIAAAPMVGGCESARRDSPFAAINPSKYASGTEQQTALHLARNRCRATALAASAHGPAPIYTPPSAPQSVNIYTRPVYQGSNGIDWRQMNRAEDPGSSFARGYADGEVTRQQRDLAKATFVACMNDHGFLEVDEGRQQ